jgi:hypothetical protein
LRDYAPDPGGVMEAFSIMPQVLRQVAERMESRL